MIDNKPQIIRRVEALEGRYTDTGLNTETFPISDAVDSERSDIAASSKAVKTAYDAATRYATTTQQGQVILTHDVGSGVQDRALTPFGAKMALDELEKNITNRLDSLESSLNERIEQIIRDLENKFNELNVKIEGKLPLFDSEQELKPSRIPGKIEYLTPTSGSLWLCFGSVNWTRIEHEGGGEINRTEGSLSICDIVNGGDAALRLDDSGSNTKYKVSIRAWRIFA